MPLVGQKWHNTDQSPRIKALRWEMGRNVPGKDIPARAKVALPSDAGRDCRDGDFVLGLSRRPFNLPKKLLRPSGNPRTRATVRTVFSFHLTAFLIIL
jgi:hypothetical protein